MSSADGAPKDAKKRNVIVFLSISLLVVVVLYLIDIPLWQAANALVEPNYVSIPEWFSDWGLYFFYALFAAVFLFGLIKKNTNCINIGLAYIKAQLIFSLVVVRLLKILIGRPRPGKGFDYHFLATSYSHNSFPSGHSADAFVSGVILFYFLRQSKYANYGFLPLIYAFLIAASRVFVSSHYPSDVAAGMAIGIMGAWVFISRLPEKTHSSLDSGNSK